MLAAAGRGVASKPALRKAMKHHHEYQLTLVRLTLSRMNNDDKILQACAFPLSTDIRKLLTKCEMQLLSDATISSPGAYAKEMKSVCQ